VASIVVVSAARAEEKHWLSWLGKEASGRGRNKAVLEFISKA